MNKYTRLSIIFSASFFPFALLVGQLAGLYFKGVNPEDRDITDGLAYLTQILVPTFATIIVGWLAAVITLFKARSTGERDYSLAQTVLVIVTLVIVGLGAGKVVENKIEDNYKATSSIQ